MKVSEAIKMLQSYDPDDHVVIGWWSRELFEEQYEIDDNTWVSICQSFLDLTDHVNEEIYDAIVYELEQSNKEEQA
jgi:hypothetical protein